ncbi:unnamed protein product, partial [Symbiodinium pilosum]
PPVPLRKMNADAEEFIPQEYWLPGQLPPPHLQHMGDGSLNMAIHPVAMQMPHPHIQHIANCVLLAPNNLPVPPPPQHAAPLTAQFGLPTLLCSQPQMRQNMQMQKFLPPPPKPPAPPTEEPQNLPVHQPEKKSPPTREECMKHAEEVLEEQRSFLGQLRILPLEEARRLWADAMNDVFKGPSPTGPGLEDLRVVVPPPDELPECAEELSDIGPVALPMMTGAAESPKLANEGALVEASLETQGVNAAKAKRAEGKKSSSASTWPGQKGSPHKEWAPHLHAPSRHWLYSPGVVSKGGKGGGKAGGGKGGKGGSARKGK